MHDPTFSHFDTIWDSDRPTYRWTDRQIDGHTSIAYTVLA